MILVFKQKIKEITDNAQVLSQYRANSLLQKGNDVPLDDTPLNLDDEKILKKYLKTACSEINKVLSGYQSNIEDADGNTLLPFEFDVADPDIILAEDDPDTPDVDETETANPDDNVLIIRAGLPETFNTSAITQMDDAIRDALESYLLYRTGKHKINETQSYYDDFTAAIGNLRTFLNTRKYSVRRNYNILE